MLFLITRTKKKRGVIYKDILKGYNLILQYTLKNYRKRLPDVSLLTSIRPSLLTLGHAMKYM